jgi:hypothetical protein
MTRPIGSICVGIVSPSPTIIKMLDGVRTQKNASMQCREYPMRTTPILLTAYVATHTVLSVGRNSTSQPIVTCLRNGRSRTRVKVKT